MTRILFQRAPEGFRTVRGGLIKDLQIRLAAAGSSPGMLDGIYGRDTEQAIRAWEAGQGRSPTGKVTDDAWLELFGAPPPIFDRCLQLTAAFEGHGYELVAGNFDDAWITWGIIGFTLKHGELGRMLKQIRVSHSALFSDAFGGLEAELVSVLDGSDARKRDWANSISIGQNRQRVREDWSAAFRRLGSRREVQEIQRHFAHGYWDIALNDAKRFGLKTEMGLALAFDVAVQNGGADAGDVARIRAKLQNNPPQTEQDLRIIVANGIAEGSKPQWITDVRRRKLAIATGSGTVHKARYAVKTWGLDEFNAGI
ncbi:peptidoglycan-binding protein [Longimicrobium sp.]|uniref:peptidoglycan-binding protein n=1 Tax=Longimicrobium sp. TaxID=2029185 RepID=UPI003B3B8F07